MLLFFYNTCLYKYIMFFNSLQKCLNHILSSYLVLSVTLEVQERKSKNWKWSYFRRNRNLKTWIWQDGQWKEESYLSGERRKKKQGNNNQIFSNTFLPGTMIRVHQSVFLFLIFLQISMVYARCCCDCHLLINGIINSN